jgi:hypothetical protein
VNAGSQQPRGRRSRREGEVLEPRWAASVANLVHHAWPRLERRAHPEGVLVAPDRDRRRGLVGLEPNHADRGNLEQMGNFFGDRGENRVWCCALRDQGRHAAQSRLLIYEMVEIVARLGVRDRRRDEFREPGEPVFRVLAE